MTKERMFVVEKLQSALFQTGDLPNELWVGMPEFVQEKIEPYATIIIRFSTADDLENFAQIVGQKLNKKTKSMWHPALERGTTTRKVYSNES
jgi:hypothetical protein